MGFYKLIFVVSLVLAFSLSGTDICVAARQLLDTPAFPTPDSVPKLTVLKAFVRRHWKFPVFSSLPHVRTQRVLPKIHIPFQPKPPHVETQPVLPRFHIPSQRKPPHGWTQSVSPRIDIPSQRKPPKTTMRKSPAKPPPLPPKDQVPSQPTLSNPKSPLLPASQIHPLPTEPGLQKSTLPNVPAHPKVELPPPAATQLPTIPATPTMQSKLPATPHLFPPPHA